MKNQYLRSLFIGLTLICASSSIVFSEQKAEKLAQETAESWLALADSGMYTQTWEQAADYFKERVTAENWEKAVKSVRVPLGKLESRKLTSAQYTKTMPGAPDGDYVILQFDASYEKKKRAIETVTPMKDKDGKWRVAGYFIK
jgi:hypothetical protein